MLPREERIAFNLQGLGDYRDTKTLCQIVMYAPEDSIFDKCEDSIICPSLILIRYLPHCKLFWICLKFRL